MIPLLSAFVMSHFHAANARRKRTVSSDSIRHVAAKVWAEVAAAHGLSLAETSPLAIVGELDGVACEIALVGEGAGTTIARAANDGSVHGRARVVPATTGGALLATLGGDRVRASDREFDAAFVAMCDEPSLVSELLATQTRETLLALRGREPRLAIDPGVVELVLEGAELVHDNLNAILALVTRLQRRPPRTPYR